MDALRIVGRRALSGSVSVSGAKNAALPIMAAALMADAPVRLTRVPRVGDVETLAQVLRSLGMHVERTTAGAMQLTCVDPAPVHAPRHLVERMRASFCVLGPLLARRGRAIVPLPGGCRIGPRPIQLHLAGLAALGADIRVTQGRIVATARHLRGAEVSLTGPHGSTVTGTANVLCAATLARGRTVIRHAAQEPELVDLGRFLQQLGARIEGLGSAHIEVHGVQQLGGGSHTLMADRIEVGTLLAAAAIAGGRVTLCRAEPAHLQSVCTALTALGATVSSTADTITLVRRQPLRATRLTAAPYPGFPTDLQPQFMALASLAVGTSHIRDRVFPARRGHVNGLQQMGARLTALSGNAALRATIEGVASLHGAMVHATDLRAAAALVLAGLAAHGPTHVTGLRHLDRGYDDLAGKLRALGADIQRVTLHPLADQSTSPASLETLPVVAAAASS